MNGRLQTLVVSGNCLSERALDALLNYIQINQSLRGVYISKNCINCLKGHTRAKIGQLRQCGLNLYIWWFSSIAIIINYGIDQLRGGGFICPHHHITQLLFQLPLLQTSRQVLDARSTAPLVYRLRSFSPANRTASSSLQCHPYGQTRQRPKPKHESHCTMIRIMQYKKKAFCLAKDQSQ